MERGLCPKCQTPNEQTTTRTLRMVPPAKMMRLRLMMIVILLVSSILGCVMGTYVGTGLNNIQMLRSVPFFVGFIILVCFGLAYLFARRPVLARIYECQQCQHRWYTLEEIQPASAESAAAQPADITLSEQEQTS